MDKEFFMPELAKREENFFHGRLPSTYKEKIHYIELQWLANDAASAVNKMQETYSGVEILQTVFAYVYDFVRMADHSELGLYTGWACNCRYLYCLSFDSSLRICSLLTSD